MASITNNELNHPAESSATLRQINIDLDEKIIATVDGNAQVHVTPSSLSMTHTSNGIVIGESGTVIDGKIHFGRTPSDIRIGAFWTFNDAMMTTIASTNYTPIPVLKYSDPPYAKWVQKLANFLSRLG